MKEFLKEFLECSKGDHVESNIVEGDGASSYIDNITKNEYIIIEGTPTAIYFKEGKTILEWS